MDFFCDFNLVLFAIKMDISLSSSSDSCFNPSFSCFNSSFSCFNSSFSCFNPSFFSLTGCSFSVSNIVITSKISLFLLRSLILHRISGVCPTASATMIIAITLSNGTLPSAITEHVTIADSRKLNSKSARGWSLPKRIYKKTVLTINTMIKTIIAVSSDLC